MSVYPAFDRLRSLNQPIPKPAQLPTEQQVCDVESLLGVKFPPSYRDYLLHYSDVNFEAFELYRVFQDGSYLDMVKEIHEAHDLVELPTHLLPFLHDNGDYYCFDLSTPGPEYKVVFWSHNGIVDESWTDFAAWVDECWIGESIRTDSGAGVPQPAPLSVLDARPVEESGRGWQ